MSLPRYLYIHVWTTLLLHVYIAITAVITSVLQKAEKCQIYQEIGGYYEGMIILQNSVLIRSISFKCIFVRLGTALMQGKK